MVAFEMLFYLKAFLLCKNILCENGKVLQGFSYKEEFLWITAEEEPYTYRNLWLPEDEKAFCHQNK